LIFLGVVWGVSGWWSLDKITTDVVLLLPLLGTTPEPQDEVEGRLLLDVVIREGPAVLELLSSEDQSLLVWGDALLVLDLGLDIVDRVRGLDLEGDSFTREAKMSALTAV
jgi:hypothetical protein